MFSKTFIVLTGIAFLGVAACDSGDNRGASAAHQSPNSEVQLLSDVQSIAPGQPLTLGLRFQTADGWHIYWRNPGDAGAAPTIEWQAPDGFSFSPVLWPSPTRFSSGDFADYGYSGDVMLMVEVQPPASLAPGDEVSIGASAEWLICRETCVPESAEFALTLPVSAESPKESRWQSLFDENRRRLPTEIDGLAAAALFAEGNTIQLEIQLPDTLDLTGRDIHFFAHSQGVVEPGAEQQVTLSEQRLQLKLSQSAFLSEAPPDPLTGVLTARRPDGPSDIDADDLALYISAPLSSAMDDILHVPD